MINPFVLYGKTDVENIASFLKERASLWLEEWLNDKVDPATLSITLDAKSTDSLAVAGNLCLECTISDSDVYLVQGFASSNRLLNGILGTKNNIDTRPGSEASKTLLKVCFTDLLRKIKSKLPGYENKQLGQCEARESEHPGRFEGGVMAAFELGAIDFNLFLPDKLLTGLLVTEVKKASSESLVPLNHCTIEGEVYLSLKAGEVDIEYGLLKEILVGDVIKLNSKIDQPMAFLTAEGDHVCEAYIGKSSNKIAAKVQITK